MRTAGSALVVLILGVTLPHTQAGVILSSSRLEKCTSSGNAEDLDCKRKIVVAMTVESGEDGGSYIEAQLPIGDTLEDEDGEAVEIEKDKDGLPLDRLVVTVSKSAAVSIYPTYYHSTVAADVRERIVERTVTQGCVDATSSASTQEDEAPTCGTVGSGGDERALGFCCKCETLDDWVSASTLPRSGATCNLFSASGLGSTAHCVEYDALRYNLFRMGPPQVDYYISVNVKHCRGQECTETPLGVSHASPLAVTDSRDVMVRIAGDFASSLASPSLSEKFLAVPDINSKCSESFLPKRCRNRLASSEMNWMVLDNTQVDSTGLTCDTVGVNEQAFVSQGSRCDVEAGSCLHGQIMALEKEAFDSLIRRESCKYLFQCLSQEGWKHPYLENSGQLQTPGTNTSSRVRLMSDRTHSTVIALQLAADNIRYVKNVHEGVIYDTSVKPFAQNSNEGTLHVVILSTTECVESGDGDCKSEFVVRVWKCTGGIQPIPAQSATVQAGETHRFSFPVRSEKPLDSPDMVEVCKAGLLDAEGAVLHEVNVYMNTTSTILKAPQENPDDRPEEGASPSREDDGSSVCESISLECLLLLGIPPALYLPIALAAILLCLCCCSAGILKSASRTVSSGVGTCCITALRLFCCVGTVSLACLDGLASACSSLRGKKARVKRKKRGGRRHKADDRGGKSRHRDDSSSSSGSETGTSSGSSASYSSEGDETEGSSDIDSHSDSDVESEGSASSVSSSDERQTRRDRRSPHAAAADGRRRSWYESTRWLGWMPRSSIHRIRPARPSPTEFDGVDTARQPDGAPARVTPPSGQAVQDRIQARLSALLRADPIYLNVAAEADKSVVEGHWGPFSVRGRLVATDDRGEQGLVFTVDAVHAFMRKRRSYARGDVQRCIPPRPLPQRWSPLPLTKALAVWTCSVAPADVVINEKLAMSGQGRTIVGAPSAAGAALPAPQ